MSTSITKTVVSKYQYIYKKRKQFFKKEMIQSSGKRVMTIEYLGIPESKEAFKDNTGLSEGLRPNMKSTSLPKHGTI